MKQRLPLYLCLVLLGAFLIFSGPAAEGARRGLSVCAQALLPSLLPFFILSNLLGELGLAELLAGTLGGAAQALFRVSGAGAQALFLGLTGGYPVGAAAVADLRRRGQISREDAERLLAFCNNSGPAFILGAAGGIFQSPGAGFLLYAAHVLAALTVGLLFRRGGEPSPDRPAGPAKPPVPFSRAFPAAVRAALASSLTVCAYVTFFSAATALLAPLDALPQPFRALALGFWELGTGMASLAGTAPAPAPLAAAAFLLGWGGVSVHGQTLAAVSGTDIRCARHLAGRALCGGIAALFTYGLARLVFPQ